MAHYGPPGGSAGGPYGSQPEGQWPGGSGQPYGEQNPFGGPPPQPAQPSDPFGGPAPFPPNPGPGLGPGEQTPPFGTVPPPGGGVPWETPPQPPQPPKKGKGGLIVVIILVVVVLLGGGGAGWYFLYGPGKSKTTDTGNGKTNPSASASASGAAGQDSTDNIKAGDCVVHPQNTNTVKVASCSTPGALKVYKRIDNTTDSGKCPVPPTNFYYVHKDNKGNDNFVLCLQNQSSAGASPSASAG